MTTIDHPPTATSVEHLRISTGRRSSFIRTRSSKALRSVRRFFGTDQSITASMGRRSTDWTARHELADNAAWLLSLSLSVCAAASIWLAPESTLRHVTVLAFWTIVPGYVLTDALLPRMSLGRGIAALALSQTTSILISSTLVWMHWWRPTRVTLSLSFILAGYLISRPPSGFVRSLRAGDVLPRWPTGRGRRALIALIAAVPLLIFATTDIAGSMEPATSGLLPQLPLTWFAGLVLVLYALWQAMAARHGVLMGVSTVVGTVIVSGTPCLAYAMPRFPWLYKHLGVIEYIRTHGSVDSSIDIYHAWPGFFASQALQLDAANISDPLTIARFWPVAISLALIACVRYITLSLCHDSRTAWIAAAIFTGANWIGQDYYSPQSLGLVLAMFLLGFILSHLAPREFRESGRVAALVVTAAVYWAILATHQLTPYMLLCFLGGLAVFGAIKPRWLIPVLFIFSLVFLLPRFDYVTQHGGIGKSPVTNNIRPPESFPEGSSMLRLSGLAAASLTVLIYGLAAIAALILLRRRQRLLSVLCAITVAAPFGVLVVQRYGDEGLLRSILFGIPGSAITIAIAARELAARRMLRVAAALLAVSLVFLRYSADDGKDAWYAVTRAEVQAGEFIEETAPADSLIVTIGPPKIPGKTSDRYYDLRYDESALFFVGLDQKVAESGVEDVVEEFTWNVAFVADGSPTYIAMSPGLAAFGELTGYWSPATYFEMQEAFEESPYWDVVFRDGDTVVLELPPIPA